MNISTREQAEAALQELSRLAAQIETTRHAAEVEIVAINEQLAKDLESPKSRASELEEALLTWADDNRDDLCAAGRKTAELRGGRFTWRTQKDAVMRQGDLDAKSAKAQAGGLLTGDGMPLIAALQHVVDQVDYHGALTVSLNISASAAVKAYKLQQLGEEQLDAIGHEFVPGEEYVTVETAELVRQ